MATQQVEAGAAGHGAEPRGKRSDEGEATYLVAIAEALWEEMERDERVYMLGEDIGVYGGAFKVTEGFIERFGADRVMDTPIAEETIVGMAGRLRDGRAPPGRRVPVRGLHVVRASTRSSTVLARYHYRAGVRLPVVLRAPSGRRRARLELPLDEPGAVVRLPGRDEGDSARRSPATRRDC